MSFTGVGGLLGAWRLESAVEVFDDGERRDEFGPDPEGYLCYNPAGRFRVSADTPDQVELFQGVARPVGDMLQQPVVSYSNGREIVITFGQEPSALA
jgi:lipocalin-like protein